MGNLSIAQQHTDTQVQAQTSTQVGEPGPPTQPPPTPPPPAGWTRALQRAFAAGLPGEVRVVPGRAGVLLVPSRTRQTSYRVALGPLATALACDCEAGRAHRPCTHRAAAGAWLYAAEQGWDVRLLGAVPAEVVVGVIYRRHLSRTRIEDVEAHRLAEREAA